MVSHNTVCKEAPLISLKKEKYKLVISKTKEYELRLELHYGGEITEFIEESIGTSLGVKGR